LIALIAKARRIGDPGTGDRTALLRFEKTILLQTHPGILAVSHFDPRLVLSDERRS